MGRIIRAVIFAIVGAAAAGLIVFFGGFLLVKMLKPADSAGWGMMVPLVFTPLGALAGALLGGLKGYRNA